jgi:hypothetical protein
MLPGGGPRWGMRREGEEGHHQPWLHASRSMSLAEVLILDLVMASLLYSSVMLISDKLRQLVAGLPWHVIRGFNLEQVKRLPER